MFGREAVWAYDCGPRGGANRGDHVRADVRVCQDPPDGRPGHVQAALAQVTGVRRTRPAGFPPGGTEVADAMTSSRALGPWTSGRPERGLSKIPGRPSAAGATLARSTQPLRARRCPDDPV